jgi:hypothetical protein
MMKKKNSILLVFGVILLLILTSGYLLTPCVKGDYSSWAEASSGLPASGTYFGVTFGDLDNDGQMDIVAASDGNGLRVFLGDGTGSWTSVSSHPAESGGFGDVTVGDYDDDGNLDIFAGSPGNSANSPTGLHVYKGDGAGGFTEVTSTSGLPTTGKWRGVAVGDVNNDGNLDLAATNGYSTTEGLHVYTGAGAGAFIDDSSGLPTDESRDSSVVLVDFSNDGNLDIAAGGSPGVSVYLGNGGIGGSMSWTESSTGLPSERFSGINATDFDNDGSQDLVLSAYNAGSGVGARAFRNVNNGASWTSVSTGLPTSGDYIDISTGDFDNDGSMDLVTAGSYSSTYGIHVYYGDGSSWTENSDILPTSNQYVGNAAGDMDGDGNLDILFGGNNGKGVIVYRNLGTEPQPPRISSTSPSNSTENVPINSAISIVFSKVMNTSSVEDAITTSPEFAWSSSWTSGNAAVTLSPSSNLELSTKYIITIEGKARSADDLSIESPYEFSFTTGDTVDTTAPTVLTSSPSSGAGDVDFTTEITITFSEPMDTAATEGAVLISPGSITKRSWDDGGSVLTLSVELEPQTTYTVTISQSARDFAGNTITSGHSVSFTTASSEDQAGDDEQSDSNIVLIAVIIIVVIVLLLLLLMARKK